MNVCLHQLIEAQVDRTPDQVAVVFEDQRLTYRELDHRANQLAHRLKALGLGPDARVGLFVERSLEMVTGILGILKAGAAYLPIDAAYPAERIAFMLADADVTCLLTQQSLLARLPGEAPQVVCLDTFDWAVSDGPGRGEARVRPDNLAYVIYTSGSTGRPKGVCIEHRNIVNYVLGVSERLRLEAGMQHATVSTIAADLGNTVIFPALATGGCLHVISQQRAENQALLSEYFKREQIDVLKIVPSHLAALQTGHNPEQVMPRARLILGGEASRLDWIERLRTQSPSCEIYNHYGPTETTVGALTYHVGSDLPTTRSGTLPLGRPLPNTHVYVLDAAGQPVAQGERGELCIGGAGVGRGYLKRPELTAEKFVADPFNQDRGGRLYRTGDVARYLADGTVEFCGRIDDQVKLHGYRIELGEIEGMLREHRGVRDAVVRLLEDEAGGKRLIGYVVPKRASQALWDWKTLHVLPDGSPVAHLNKNETDYIYNEIFVLQAYLRHGITIRDGDCIVDAGANIGLFTVFASRLARDLRLFSFEPNPAAFACLKANADAWGTGVKCLPLGLSRENTTADLTFFEGLSLLSGFYADAATEREVVKNYVFNQEAESLPSEQFAAEVGAVIDNRLRAKTVTAQLRTLSSVIAEHGLDRIDLLKINVEKSELDVLRGLTPGDWPKIRQLVIEVDQRESVDPISTLLEGHGFEVLVEQDPLLRNTDLCYVYAIRPSSDGASRLMRQPADGQARAVLPLDGEVLTPATLRAHLKARVPPYMVPSAFVLMDKFPLTSNGKIDRHALPAVSPEALPHTPDVRRPLTETEQALAAIWTELLKVESVGVDDDFFDMGGHSLLAIKAVSRIRDVFEVDLQTRTLFENSTLGALATVLADAKGLGGDVQRIQRRTQQGPCTLSFAQEQLWFLDQLAPGSPVYNIVDVIRFGSYDAAAMRKALTELVRRHEVLRTVVSARDGHPVQNVLPTIDLAISEVDLRSLPAEKREHEWTRVVREAGRKSFDLSHAPLFRVTMVHLSPQDHRLLLTIHHVVADEWSMELIHQEVDQLYEAFARGRRSPLPDLPIQYADFACWQRESSKGVLQDELSYWKAELAGAPSVLELVADKPRPAVQSFRGATEIFAMPRQLVDRVKTLGRQEQATLFMVLEATFAALLHRYTGQDDILVGTPISGRTHSETERLIGCFLNTVVLRSRFTDDLSFRSLLRQVRDRALGAYAHPNLPFNQLVADLAPERDASRTPLFQVMFVLHNAEGVSQVSKVSGNKQLETGTSKFDLTLLTSETEHGLDGMIEYSTDLFDAETIQRLCRHYATLLEAIARDPDESIARLPLLTPGERQQLLVDWNDTATAFPAGVLCLHQLIEAQAASTPDRVAVVFEDRQLTYGDLNHRADQLAHHLKRLKVGPDVRVGLLVERSADMVVGLLGILKAGGAYVPLDPAFPPDRLAYMVEDSGMGVLVTHRDLDGSLSVRPPVILRLDTHKEEMARRRSDKPNLSGSSPEHLAYVLYTSGSTGKPKGVEITHSAIVNFVLSMQQAPGFTANDTLLAVTTLSFDIAGLELYLPLVCGGRVVIAGRDDVLDPSRLMDRMRDSGCTVMQATPATWRALVNAGWSGSASLKVLCGGEALPRDLAQALLPRCGELWNLYGPTETTVWSTIERITSPDGALSIGRPIANTQVFVLDANRDLVPPGLMGELCIGGAGVARGYLHREELTRERFVPSPFDPTARLYRTGDLGRWLPDGRLECLGRNDHQVKVRGFRIEPGEIEAGIARHPAIRDVVVIAREYAPGDTRLVAYVVAEQPPADLIDQLRALIRAASPEYMVPAAFVRLDALPRTANGKLDREALPAPDAGASAARGYEAPVGEIEATLAHIWAAVLKLDRVGRHDHFFELGGHSLLAIMAVSRIRDVFAADLQIRALFENPTLAGLARVLTGATGSGAPIRRIAARHQDGPCALSFVQEQLWFLDQLAPGSPVYNIVDVIGIHGAYDAAAMRSALNELAVRHDVLRTAFAQRNGQPMQVVVPTLDLVLSDLDVSSLPEPDREGEWTRVVREEGRKPFDLSRAPLFRGTVVHVSPQEHRLLLTIHHIIADEWSMELIHQEVHQLYEAFAQGRPSLLPDLPIQYADFACWQRQWLQGDVLRQEIAYWTDELAGASAILELPTDKPRPAVQSFRGATEIFALPQRLLERLKTLGRREQATLFMILEAGFATLLHRYTGQDDILVGTPVSGRTLSETERLIGCFLNTVVLRSRFTDQLSFRSLLQQVRERALGAYAHPDLPFEHLVAAVAPERDPSRTPLFQVMFALHNAHGLSHVSTVSGHRQLETGTSKFDLTLFISETERGLEGLIEYSTDLFEAETIRRVGRHYGTLLEAVTHNPDQIIASLPLLTDAEREQLLIGWNDTGVGFSAEGQCLHQLIDAHAGRTPDRVAVVFEGQQWTYGELNRRADQLGHHLRRLKVGPDVRVGLLVERSPEMVVALLGILKAGGAYVPLDPSFPPDRLGYMVEDSGMQVLVTHRDLDRALSVRPPVIVRLDSHEEEIARHRLDQPTPSAPSLEHLAYVLYTSGSTGKPKGVGIPHSAIVNFLLSMQRAPGFTAADTLLAVTTLSFDIAGLELYLPLVSGGTVAIASHEDAVDPIRLMDRIQQSRCTVMQATPATWRALVTAGWSGSANLRVLCGGEALSRDLAQALLARGAEVWNMYGPTETTVWSTIERITSADGAVSIGRPIANTQVFVLDAHRQVVPPGLVGELYIGGYGVARGYLNREELTRERFVLSPFDPTARLYRTGDLGRWLPDGRLEWLGRMDHQVKVRGFRIELGEIEAGIVRHPAVRDVVVVSREDLPGDTRLVAYVVAEQPPADLANQLRALIRATMPEYMVPADFVRLEALPRTANGKLDRKALPKPSIGGALPRAGAVAPRTATEETVMGVFRGVLERDDFGVFESFFDLGGHSLMAARLVSRLRAASGLDLPLRNLFERPTVAALAEAVDALSWSAGWKAPTGSAGDREEIEV